MNQSTQEHADAQSYINKGIMYMQHAQWPEALEAFGNAVFLAPFSTPAKQLFIDAGARCTFEDFNDALKHVAIQCLQDDQLQLEAMNNAWLSFFMMDPAVEPLRQAGQLESFEAFTQYMDDPANRAAVLDALNDPYFNVLCAKIPLPSYRLEKLITYTRRWILTQLVAVQAPDETPPFTGFLPSLTHHCWMNEYVYAVSEVEETMLAQLRLQLDAFFAQDKQGADAAALIPKLYIIGAYQLLHALKSKDEILAAFANTKDVDLYALLTLQIKNVEEEQNIKKTIPKRGKIKDDISAKVQQQYEENPYPRWKNPDVSVLKPPSTEVLDILVPGCGTGYLSATLATQFPEAKIHNVDLSLSSMAYAIRQCRKLGLRNLTFEQADILDLASLNQKYDFIVCTGVLHHMKDPEAGLKVLCGLLKDGGVMNLALYSEKGRRDVVAAHQYIAEKNYQPTRKDIRQCRHDFHEEIPDDDIKKDVTHRRDFYSTSMCRDLLFHVQEHRYTIPQIEKMLDDHGLAFIEFHLRIEQHLQMFLEEFPQENAECDLKKWAAFEEKHPALFSNMYDFTVCRKEDYEAHKAQWETP